MGQLELKNKNTPSSLCLVVMSFITSPVPQKNQIQFQIQIGMAFPHSFPPATENPVSTYFKYVIMLLFSVTQQHKYHIDLISSPHSIFFNKKTFPKIKTR